MYSLRDGELEVGVHRFRLGWNDAKGGWRSGALPPETLLAGTESSLTMASYQGPEKATLARRGA